MNARHFLICLAGLVWLFLSVSNIFVGKSSVLAGSQTPSPTPIQTIKIQTPLPELPSPPKLTISPNNDNSQTPTSTPLDLQTPMQTPKTVETPTPTIPPRDNANSTEGSWLPWIIAGILFVIVIFLLGRKSKD